MAWNRSAGGIQQQYMYCRQDAQIQFVLDTVKDLKMEFQCVTSLQDSGVRVVLFGRDVPGVAHAPVPGSAATSGGRPAAAS